SGRSFARGLRKTLWGGGRHGGPADQSGKTFRLGIGQGTKLLFLRCLDLLHELPVQVLPLPGGMQDDTSAVDVVDVSVGQVLGDQVVGDPGGRGPARLSSPQSVDIASGPRIASSSNIRH